MKAPGPASNTPRTDARKSKLRSLTPEQSAALLAWLFKENVRYTVAISRMFSRFGVKLSLAQMHKFWHAHSSQLTHVSDTSVLFEITVVPLRPVHIVVKQNPFRLEMTPA
jgi:hypothetical protein